MTTKNILELLTTGLRADVLALLSPTVPLHAGDWVRVMPSEEVAADRFHGTSAKILRISPNRCKLEEYVVDQESGLLEMPVTREVEPPTPPWPQIIVLQETRPARWGLPDEHVQRVDTESDPSGGPSSKAIKIKGVEESQVSIHPALRLWPSREEAEGAQPRPLSLFNFSTAIIYKLLVKVQPLRDREPVTARWHLTLEEQWMVLDTVWRGPAILPKVCLTLWRMLQAELPNADRFDFISES